MSGWDTIGLLEHPHLRGLHRFDMTEAYARTAGSHVRRRRELVAVTAKGNQAHSLRRTIEEAEQKLRTLEMIPDKDVFTHETMVRVRVNHRYGSNTERTYLFVKIINMDVMPQRPDLKDRWYFTGTMDRRDHGTMRPGPLWVSWDKLVSWLVNDVELQTWEILLPESAMRPVQLIQLPDETSMDAVQLHEKLVATVRRDWPHLPVLNDAVIKGIVGKIIKELLS